MSLATTICVLAVLFLYNAAVILSQSRVHMPYQQSPMMNHMGMQYQGQAPYYQQHYPNGPSHPGPGYGHWQQRQNMWNDFRGDGAYSTMRMNSNDQSWHNRDQYSNSRMDMSSQNFKNNDYWRYNGRSNNNNNNNNDNNNSMWSRLRNQFAQGRFTTNQRNGKFNPRDYIKGERVYHQHNGRSGARYQRQTGRIHQPYPRQS